MHFRDENIPYFCYIHDNTERQPAKAEQLGQAKVYCRVVQDLLRNKLQPTQENTNPEGYGADDNKQILKLKIGDMLYLKKYINNPNCSYLNCICCSILLP